MTENEFREICLCGETTRVQFKREFTSQKEIAKNIVIFVKGESANRFRTIVWRTIQKSESTIQKNENTTQKSENTIQKSKNTTQKDESTTQKELSATQKKVLDFFRENPKANRIEAAQVIGDITEDGIKFIIAKLQGLGLLKREGGRKTGIWVVIDKTKDN